MTDNLATAFENISLDEERGKLKWMKQRIEINQHYQLYQFLLHQNVIKPMVNEF